MLERPVHNEPMVLQIIHMYKQNMKLIIYIGKTEGLNYYKTVKIHKIITLQIIYAQNFKRQLSSFFGIQFLFRAQHSHRQKEQRRPAMMQGAVFFCTSFRTIQRV